MSELSKNRIKTSRKFNLCRCCSKQQESKSGTDAIESYFGKEFTEYEYVIENLAIRPVPKKLLDLVPVHSTASRKDDIYDLPCIENPSEPVPKRPTGSVFDWEDSSPRLKILPDDEDRTCHPRNPLSKSFNPSVDETTNDKNICGSFALEPYKPLDFKITEENLNAKGYKHPKEVITDLFRASEQTLNFKSNPMNNKPIPIEIQNTIDTLKFKKPALQFYPKQAKPILQSPHLYFSRIDSDIQSFKEKLPYQNSVNTIESFKINNNKKEISASMADSVVQTEALREPFFKKKNLKWKIIINKHPNCKP